jgi:excisionase family DNA binding protein
MIAVVDGGVVRIRSGGAEVKMTVDELADLAKSVCPKGSLTDDSEGLIGCAEAAAIAMVSDSAMREWFRDGKVPAVRVGKKWLTKRSDVLRALEGRTC